MQHNQAAPGSDHEPEFKFKEFKEFFRVERGMVAGAIGFGVLLVTDGPASAGV